MAFFIDEGLTSTAVGSHVTIERSEARHMLLSRRIRPGEVVKVSNGTGLIVTGVVSSVNESTVGFTVSSVSSVTRATPPIILIQALAKGGRDELAIQSATELGVSAVVPWQAERSIPQWSTTKRERGEERWRSIVREASKQSECPYVPHVCPLVTTHGLVERAKDWSPLLLDPASHRRLSLENIDRDLSRPIALVVGPEGGVTPAERDLLEQAGAGRVRLGDTILRTSTAGPAALALLNVKLGRW